MGKGNQGAEKIDVTADRELKDYEENKKYYEEPGKNYEYKKNEHQREYNMGSVHKVLTEKMGEKYGKVYQNIENVRKSGKPIELVAGIGSKYNKEGLNVLKGSLAGSGFMYWRGDYKDKELKGNHGIGFIETIRRWWNSVYSSLTRKPLTLTKLQEKEALAYGMSNQVVDPTGKKAEHVRSFVRKGTTAEGKEVTKEVINIAGAQSFAGLRNSGDYSIENAREYMFYKMTTSLDKLLEKAEREGKDPKELKIPVLLKGHSRGGVAAVEAAMMIKQWVYENYPKYEESVHFDLVQYDPVPGPDAKVDYNVAVNHNDTRELLTMDGPNQQKYANLPKEQQKFNPYNKEGKIKMRPLGKSANTTVTYSMQDNHSLGFEPQKVLGSKCVILTPFEHSSGFKGSDKSQMEHEDFNKERKGIITDKDGNQKKSEHVRAYFDSVTNKRYRNSGLNRLDEGVYVVDEENNLIRMNSAEDVEELIDAITKDAKGSDSANQRDRHNILKETARNWFENHPEFGKEREAEHKKPEPEINVKEEGSKVAETENKEEMDDEYVLEVSDNDNDLGDSFVL